MGDQNAAKARRFGPVNRPVRHPSVFVWLTGPKCRVLATVRHCKMCI
ncbi:hypothetical protein Hanom_Chr17g01559691 [Helianthus anomalus]